MKQIPFYYNPRVYLWTILSFPASVLLSVLAIPFTFMISALIPLFMMQNPISYLALGLSTFVSRGFVHNTGTKKEMILLVVLGVLNAALLIYLFAFYPWQWNFAD